MEKPAFSTPEYSKEHAQNKEEGRKFFEDSKNYLQKLYGIEFNTIELIGLRKICEQVWQDFWKNRFTFDEIMPYAEVECRFLQEFFDMTDFDRMQMLKTEEERKAYFKKKQEEKNLI